MRYGKKLALMAETRQGSLHLRYVSYRQLKSCLADYVKLRKERVWGAPVSRIIQEFATVLQKDFKAIHKHVKSEADLVERDMRSLRAKGESIGVFGCNIALDLISSIKQVRGPLFPLTHSTTSRFSTRHLYQFSRNHWGYRFKLLG